MNKLTAALYARKSSESRERQVQSIGDQKEIGLQIASQENLELVKIVTEEKSASKVGREGFEEIVRGVLKKEYKIIVVWDLDRLSRNLHDSSRILSLLQNGFLEKIITPSKTYTWEQDELELQFKFVFSQYYSSTTRKNIKRGVMASFMRGNIVTGWVPTGYVRRYHDDEKKQQYIIKDPDLAYQLEKAFHMFLYEGCTQIEVCDYLLENTNLKSHLKIRKKRLQGIQNWFSNALRNDTYCGWVHYQDQKRRGNHEPYITDDEFYAIQQKLRGKKKLDKLEPNPDFILNRTLRCTCGSHMTGYNAKRKYGYYKCFNSSCPHKYNIKKEWIEESFLQILDTFTLAESEIIKLKEIMVNKIIGKDVDLEKEIRIKEKLLKDEELYQERLLDMYASGRISLENYDEKISISKERMGSLNFETQKLHKTLTMGYTVIDKGLELLKNFRSMYLELDIKKKHLLNNALFPDGIFVSAQSIEDKKYVLKHSDRYLFVGVLENNTHFYNSPSDETQVLRNFQLFSRLYTSFLTVQQNNQKDNKYSD